MRLTARCRGSFVLLLVLALSVPVMARPAAAAPLRGTDWNAVLASDPRVRVQQELASSQALALGPYITVQGFGQEVAGYAATQNVLYGDLDADGDEEAVIPVQSGTAAGLAGFLVHREVEERPLLVAAVAGNRLGIEMVQGTLMVTTPHYAGFEPNCCPSAQIVTVHVLAGNELVEIDERTRPNPSAQEATVLAYYQALNERRIADAYAFLSPAFQARYPFSAWTASYASTQRITVEQVRGQLLPDAVAVTIVSVERLPNGMTVTRRFGGAWHLVWSPTSLRWLLDRADIAGSE
jgi:hypothetical protein